MYKKKQILILILFTVKCMIFSEDYPFLMHNENHRIEILNNRVYCYGSIQKGNRIISGYFYLDIGFNGTYILGNNVLDLDPDFSKEALDTAVPFINPIAFSVDKITIGQSSIESFSFDIIRFVDQEDRVISINDNQYNVLGLMGGDILFHSNFFLSCNENYFSWIDNLDISEFMKIKVYKSSGGTYYFEDFPYSLREYLQINGKMNRYILDTGYSGSIGISQKWVEGLSLWGNEVFYREDRRISLSTYDEVQVFDTTFYNGTITSNAFIFSSCSTIGMEIIQNFDIYYQITDEPMLYLKSIYVNDAIDLSENRSPYFWEQTFNKYEIYNKE